MATLSLVAIRTPDIEKTMQFYEVLLGKTFVREKHGKDLVHYAAELRDRVVFEIYPGIKSSISVGFRVRSLRQALARIAGSLTKAPKLTKEGDRIIRAIIYDPDDRMIYLSE